MENMDLKTVFRRLGLSKHAFSAYEALRLHGALLVSQISSKTGVSRPALYRGISDLRKKNFIRSRPLGKRTAYEITNPKLIEREFNMIFRGVRSAVKKNHPKTEKLYDDNVRFLSGFRGIRDAFDDVVSHTPRGETFYRYTSERDLSSVNQYLSREYRLFRDQKKLERLVISNPASGKQKKPRLERFIKYIPPERSLFNQNIIQIVYGNRLLFIDLNQEKAIIIENRALAEFQKVIFRQLYLSLS